MECQECHWPAGDDGIRTGRPAMVLLPRRGRACVRARIVQNNLTESANYIVFHRKQQQRGGRVVSSRPVFKQSYNSRAVRNAELLIKIRTGEIKVTWWPCTSKNSKKRLR